MSLTKAEIERLAEYGTLSPMVGECYNHNTPAPIKSNKTNKGENTMTTTNNTATKAEMTINALKAKAHSQNYKEVNWVEKCPLCGKRVYKFDKSGHPYIIACVCGYRKAVAKKVYVRKGVPCANPDCRATLCEYDTDGICTNCRNNGYKAVPVQQPAQPAPKKSKPAPRLCKCGATLPPDRKQSCYNCVAPSRKKAKPAPKQEPAQQGIDM